MAVPHTSEQLQPLSHTYWACALQQEKAPQGEAHVPQLESSPFSLQPEKSPRSNVPDLHVALSSDAL